MTEAFAGLLLAVAVILAARVVGFESDRSFYPTVLVFIALLYVLFGVQAGTLFLSGGPRSASGSTSLLQATS